MAAQFNKKLRKFAAAAAKRLGLPEHIVPGGFEISLVAGELGKKLYISGHGGLITADGDVASFKAPGGEIRIIGSGLLLDAVSATRAYVTGEIREISL